MRKGERCGKKKSGKKKDGKNEVKWEDGNGKGWRWEVGKL
jgi:hypothetical protein